jgi:hypothetical protein
VTDERRAIPGVRLFEYFEFERDRNRSNLSILDRFASQFWIAEAVSVTSITQTRVSWCARRPEGASR